MALRIKRESKKNVINHLERLGFSVKFFNESPEARITKDDKSVYGEPIQAVSNTNGDEYDIYWGNEWNGWDNDDDSYRYFEEVLIKDGEGNLIVKKDDSWWSKNALIVVVKTGKAKNFINERELDILKPDDEYQGTVNEFSNLSDFLSIDAPDYSVVYATNPQVSVAQPILNIEEITDLQFENSKKLMEEQKKIWLETQKEENKGTLKTAMWTFDEINELYNTKCTSEDKRAFFIYLQNRARKKLKGEWSEKYGSSYPAEAVDILELMKKGRLFVDLSAKKGERLQPRVIYRSGNIWTKYASLTNNKNEYIRRFGEEIYQLHFNELDKMWKEVWQNRLRVSGGNVSMYAKIVPVASICKEFRISEITSPRNRDHIQKNWDIYVSTKGGQIVEDIVNKDKKSTDVNIITKTSLTLHDGFIQWLKQAGEGKESMEHGIQWSGLTTNVNHVADRYLSVRKNPYGPKEKDRWEREKDDARKVGERLFTQFLQDGLQHTDQERLEVLWNSIYNAYIEPKMDEVPIGFTYRKFIGSNLFLLKKHNLNALRYYLTRGSVGLAYGVGIGKTFCSIFVMKQALDLGLAERPLVIVPNQVYAQFVNEIKRGLGTEFDATIPNSRTNAFYNGQKEFYNQKGNNAVNGINICTYEATPNLIFTEKDSESNEDDWMDSAVNILEMGNDSVSTPIRQKWKEKYSEGLFGRASKISADEKDIEDEMLDDLGDVEELFPDENSDGGKDLGGYGRGGALMYKEAGLVETEKPKKEFQPIFIDSPTTNYDFVCVDEAHNFNTLFTSVVAPPESITESEGKDGTKKIDIKRTKNPFSAIRETSGSGEGSAQATKLFLISQYIQNKNKFGNTIVLSATPFTNSPLQVYTMMTILNFQILRDMNMTYIKQFFDLFAKTEFADDITTQLSLVRRLKFIGWQNAIPLQKLVYRYFDKSTREEEEEVADRPQKIVLPLKKILINGKEYELAKENRISTTIRMSEIQITLWERVKNWASGKIGYEDLFNSDTVNATFLGGYDKKKKEKAKKPENEEDGAEIDVENPDDLADSSDEKGRNLSLGVRRLMSLLYGRQICLNPYLFKGAGYKEDPTPQQYVEASPKLLYVMGCIRSVKEYHEKSETNPFMSGQIIYMDYGIKAFPLIRDYLIENLGFQPEEIGIIAGSGNYIGKKKARDKKTVQDAFLGKGINEETGAEFLIPDTKRIKVLIGSQSIKEGINLQDKASVLYNCFLDFNPTDRIQLEGRIWRQGNEYANVRIVTPLIADCIDVFIFQKLEDKTERINQIWTRNGQIQELDTTSFDPSELKYELITDPEILARLEREKRIEDIQEKKTDASREFSEYLNLKSVWEKGDKANYPQLTGYLYSDFRFAIYYTMMQIRPDLIDRPLLNQGSYFSWLDNWNKNSSYKFEQREFPTIYNFLYYNLREFGNDYNNPYYFQYDEYYKNGKQADIVQSFFNYTVPELVDIMVRICKEQKIAYPLSYSKNWREVMASNTETPIVEGDLVEFDTKKGRKQGVVDFAVNSEDDRIVQVFYKDFLGSYNFEDEIKKSKIKVETNKSWDDLTKVEVKAIADFLRYLMIKENDSNNLIHDSSGQLMITFLPKTVDIGDFEEIDVLEKNVSKVKDPNKKGVEPTKYPEPFIYSNKDAKENVVDILLFLNAKYNAEWKRYESREGFSVFRDGGNNPWLAINSALEPKDQISFPTNKFGLLLSTLFPSNNDNAIYQNKKFGDEEYLKMEVNNLWKSTWIEVENKWDEYTYSRGLFFGLYKFKTARDIVDFNIVKEKKFRALGIETRSDLESLIANQKTLLNTLDLEATQLYDKQVFEELVQEVIRRQQELMSDELRFGNSFTSRAEQFANCNTEYLGNDMLSIFNNNPNKDTIKCGHVYTDSDKLEQRKVGEEVIEVIEEVKVTKSRGEKEVKTTEPKEMSSKEKYALILEKLEALQPLLEIYEEGSEEYTGIMEKIDALNEVRAIYED